MEKLENVKKILNAVKYKHSTFLKNTEVSSEHQLNVIKSNF